MAKILAVDDSPSMRQMVHFTLKSAGHDIVEAVDGKDALDIAKTNLLEVLKESRTRIHNPVAQQSMEVGVVELF